MIYATFMQRSIAFVIDTLLVTLLSMLLSFLTNEVFETNFPYQFTTFFLIIFYCYSAVLETYEAGGQTIGKKIMSIGVTSNRFQKVNLLNTSLRFLGKFIIPFGFILHFFDGDKRCLHDYFGNTKVIKK